MITDKLFAQVYDIKCTEYDILWYTLSSLIFFFYQKLVGRQPRFGRGREQISEFVVELVVGHGGQAFARLGYFFATSQVLLDVFDHSAGSVVLLVRRYGRRRRGSAELMQRRRRCRGSDATAGPQLRRSRGLRVRRVREHPHPIALRVDGLGPVPAVTPYRRHSAELYDPANAAAVTLLALTVQRRLTWYRRRLQQLCVRHHRSRGVFF